jgi:tetratricopeptide (TPR) repeat protein
MSILLALLAQVGPFAGAPAPQRPAVEGRTTAPSTPRAKPRAVSAPPPPNRLQLCLTEAERAPQQALAMAKGWLVNVTGPARIAPLQCLGTAQTNLAQWADAEQSFLAARDAASATDKALRAQMGSMAANAAMAAGGTERALGLLDVAHGDAAEARDIRLIGEIAIDRARALVLLKRQDEAVKALVEARTSSPDNPLAWLLSATLSRRMGKLGEAQAQISTAATLQPGNPEIGLEAGVIAVLAGQTEAARRSWQSVIDLAPDSESAETARAYLAQLPAQSEVKTNPK